MKSITGHILNFLLLTVLLGTAGCIYDSPDENFNEEVGEKNIIGYMAMNLQMSGDDTRASVGDEFEFGNNGEVALASNAGHYAIFYNSESKVPVAIASLTGMNKDESGDKNAIYSVVFATIVGRSEYKEDFEKLEKCIVLLNSSVQMTELWSKTETELLSTTVNSPYYTDSNGIQYMTMSNAIYAEGNTAKVSSTVDPTKIFPTQMEAIEQAWKGNAAVTAYVERLVGKVKLRYENEAYNQGAEKIFTPSNNEMITCEKINENGIPYYSDKHANGNRYQYRIKVTGWGINALEQESYLFRQIQPNRGYFTGWNNAGVKRAYWAEDPNYGRATYPSQFRPAVDNTAIHYYKGRNNILRNRSFTELNASHGIYNYALENTYDFADATFSNLHDGKLEYLAGSHIILCAELQSNIEDGVNFKATDIYRDRTGNFYRNQKECIKAMVSIFNNQLESHSFLKYTYYDWTNGGGNTTLYAMTKGSYNLWIGNTKVTGANIDQIADNLLSDATIAQGDGQQILWTDDFKIKDDQGNELQIYTLIDEVDSKNNKKLRTANPNDIKSLIYQYVGAMEHFNGGKMYYAIPLGLVKAANDNSTTQSKYSIYGLVRNCVYDILIHDITGLGTSVDNVNEPIIPNKTYNNERLFISFDILDWHLTEQNVPGVIN